jgi:outer membrane protein assembly factor BamB
MNDDAHGLFADVPAARRQSWDQGAIGLDCARGLVDIQSHARALDADSGEVRWKFQTPRPINAAVTLTAGGLLFTADLGGRFYAFARSGHVPWQHELGQVTGGGVVTYLANGRQRVAIASGMKSSFWPGVIDASRIVIFGVEAPEGASP